MIRVRILIDGEIEGSTKRMPLIDQRAHILQPDADLTVLQYASLKALNTILEAAEFVRESGEEAPPVEVKYSVILVNPGEKRIHVIKEIRALFDLPLKEANDLSQTPNAVLKNNLTADEAIKIKERLETVGAAVEII